VSLEVEPEVPVEETPEGEAEQVPEAVPKVRRGRKPKTLIKLKKGK